LLILFNSGGHGRRRYALVHVVFRLQELRRSDALRGGNWFFELRDSMDEGLGVLASKFHLHVEHQLVFLDGGVVLELGQGFKEGGIGLQLGPG